MKIVAVFIFLVILIATEVKGQDKGYRNRCLCIDKGVDMVLPKLTEKYEIIFPSPSCGKQEIIAILKSGERKCLNPESKFTQKVVRRILENRRDQQ